MALPYSPAVRTLASIGSCAWLPSRAATAAMTTSPWPRSRPRTRPRSPPAQAEPSAAPARAAAAARPLRPAHLHHRSARRLAPLRRRARGHDPRSQGRGACCGRRSSTSGPRHHRRRERPPVDGVRARLPDLAPLLGLLHGPAGLHPDRPVPRLGGQPEPRRPELAAVRAPGAAPPLQPQGRPAPGGPGRDAVRRLRGRRRGRRPGRERPEPRPHARQDDPDRPAAERRLLDPARQPVPEPRPARCPRSTRTACATRTGSRSTAAPAPHHRRRGPGRDRGDRLHPGALGRPPAARGLQLRLGQLRGPEPVRVRPRARAHPAGAPAHALAGLLLDHRRLRAPRPLARPRLDRPVRVRRLLRRHAAAVTPAPAVGRATTRPG